MAQTMFDFMKAQPATPDLGKAVAEANDFNMYKSLLATTESATTAATGIATHIATKEEAINRKLQEEIQKKQDQTDTFQGATLGISMMSDIMKTPDANQKLEKLNKNYKYLNDGYSNGTIPFHTVKEALTYVTPLFKPVTEDVIKDRNASASTMYAVPFAGMFQEYANKKISAQDLFNAINDAVPAIAAADGVEAQAIQQSVLAGLGIASQQRIASMPTSANYDDLEKVKLEITDMKSILNSNYYYGSNSPNMIAYISALDKSIDGWINQKENEIADNAGLQLLQYRQGGVSDPNGYTGVQPPMQTYINAYKGNRDAAAAAYIKDSENFQKVQEATNFANDTLNGNAPMPPVDNPLATKKAQAAANKKMSELLNNRDYVSLAETGNKTFQYLGAFGKQMNAGLYSTNPTVVKQSMDFFKMMQSVQGGSSFLNNLYSTPTMVKINSIIALAEGMHTKDGMPDFTKAAQEYNSYQSKPNKIAMTKDDYKTFGEDSVNLGPLASDFMVAGKIIYGLTGDYSKVEALKKSFENQIHNVNTTNGDKVQIVTRYGSWEPTTSKVTKLVEDFKQSDIGKHVNLNDVYFEVGPQGSLVGRDKLTGIILSSNGTNYLPTIDAQETLARLGTSKQVEPSWFDKILNTSFNGSSSAAKHYNYTQRTDIRDNINKQRGLYGVVSAYVSNAVELANTNGTYQLGMRYFQTPNLSYKKGVVNPALVISWGTSNIIERFSAQTGYNPEALFDGVMKIAKVESGIGLNKGTYGEGRPDRGVMQINKNTFQSFITPTNRDMRILANIAKTSYGIDVTKLTFKDLDRPDVSMIVGMMGMFKKEQVTGHVLPFRKDMSNLSNKNKDDIWYSWWKTNWNTSKGAGNLNMWNKAQGY